MHKTLVVVVGLAILLAAVAAVSAEAQQPASAAPTFSKDVAPILYKNCVSCHRPGEIGADVAADVRTGASVCEGDCECGDEPHDAAVACRSARRHISQRADTLSDAERQTLTAWAAGGAVNGEPSDLPAQPTFSDGWALGKPDVVLEMQEDYHVPAKGTVQYEWLYIPTELHRGEVGEVTRNQAGQPQRRPPRADLLSSEARRKDAANRACESAGPIESAAGRAGRVVSSTAQPGGDAAAADRDIRTRDESAGGAGRYGVPARAWRHPRASDALHRDWTAGHRPHESRHHLRDRTGAAQKCAPSIS